MSRRPNPRADLMRHAVAEEAARIMREQGVDDYLLAKRKAADSLTRSHGGQVLTFAEITPELIRSLSRNLHHRH